MDSILATHKKKLYELGYTDDIKIEPDKVLFHLSRDLSDVEKSELRKGLKLSLEKYLLTFEKFYRSISKFSMFENNFTDPQNFKNTLRQIAFKSFQTSRRMFQNVF